MILQAEVTAVPRKSHQPPRVLDGKGNPEYQRFVRKRRQRWLNKYKLYKGCEICGYNQHHMALDFDHLDRKDKLFTVSSTSMSRNLKSLLKEVRKCRVLCANCHRITSFDNDHFKQKKILT